ncbi:hypothetical protein Dda_4396 [Drechslerella dactyloides]|uniref:Uncharacterized protein n=1 Tax=Drechslerella dactyloides TaxID=74499 RepID=A0AAD6IWY1_DREDA|nr:hypothetical protein Dda_4396 [Drechslerella dactyloides]
MYRKDIVPKSPSDRFAVREATMDDIQALTQLWYDSYNNSNTFWEVMTPDDPITRRWWDGVWAMGIEAGPTKIATAVVEDLENDKRLVAMGRLNVAQADGSQADYFMPEYPTTWDPQLTENFWGAMAKARKEIMGNRPHWYLKLSTTVVETFETGGESDEESSNNGSPPTTAAGNLTPGLRADDNRIIRTIFRASQTQWVDDPIITQWRNPEHRVHDVLARVDDLYQAWTSVSKSSFYPFADPLWLQTCGAVGKASLPWHSNQVGMPDDIDTSWPFHFKIFEQELVRKKGARVGDSSASGYVAQSSEANCWCIRALQQELREKSTSKPILVYDNFDEVTIHSARTFFGLESYRVSLSANVVDTCRDLMAMTREGNQQRPVIFAATMASRDGRCDNLDIICWFSKKIPLVLHVDASRNFDYITTLSDATRKRLGIKRLTLSKSLFQPLELRDDSVAAHTIVAGGADHTEVSFGIGLKPASLGDNQMHPRVAYIRGPDSTLSGSRDSLPPLIMALQEIRFGRRGFQEIYEKLAEIRMSLLQAFEVMGVEVHTPPYSLDIIFKSSSCSEERKAHLKSLGGVETRAGDIMIAIQPSVKRSDLLSIMSAISPDARLTALKRVLANAALNFEGSDFSRAYRVPQSVVDALRMTVESWKIQTRSAAGYPLHMGSCSALGPIVGKFLDVTIPTEWLKIEGDKLLDTRMRAFGLHDSGHNKAYQSQFKAAFTNGSTMGNRMAFTPR